MDDFDSELMKAKENEEEINLMNDETFGDCCPYNDDVDWEDRDANGSGTINDHNVKNGYNDADIENEQELEIAHSLSQIMGDDDDDDDDDDVVVGAKVKTKPVRIGNHLSMDESFDSVPTVGLFLDLSELIEGRQNIWGSPVRQHYYLSKNMLQSSLYSSSAPDRTAVADDNPITTQIKQDILPDRPPLHPNVRTVEELEREILAEKQSPKKMLTLEEVERQLRDDGNIAAAAAHKEGVTPRTSTSNSPQQQGASPIRLAHPIMESSNRLMHPAMVGPNRLLQPGTPSPISLSPLGAVSPNRLMRPVTVSPVQRFSHPVPDSLRPVVMSTDTSSQQSGFGFQPDTAQRNGSQADVSATSTPSGGQLPENSPQPGGVTRDVTDSLARIHAHNIRYGRPPQPQGPPPDYRPEPRGMMMMMMRPTSTSSGFVAPMMPVGFGPRHPAASTRLPPAHLQQQWHNQYQFSRPPFRISHPFHSQQQQQHHRHHHQYHGSASSPGRHDYQQDEWNVAEPTVDDYSGLMTQREKDWVIKIQLMQLQTDNPYVDDYYYTCLALKKIKEESQKSRGSRAEPLLVIPQLARSDMRPFTPQQYQGSLGRLGTISIHSPRQVIDKLPPGEQEEIRRHESKRLKELLISIEKYYDTLLDIDDREKKTLAEPIECRPALLEQRQMLISQLFQKVVIDRLKHDENRDSFMHLLSVRKGLALLARLLPLVLTTEALVLIRALLCYNHLQPIRDWHDEVWCQTFQSGSFVISKLDYPSLISLATDLTSEMSTSNYLQSKFGVSLTLSIIVRGESLYQQEPLMSGEQLDHWKSFVDSVATLIGSTERELATFVVNRSSALSHFRRFVDNQPLSVLEDKLKLTDDS